MVLNTVCMGRILNVKTFVASKLMYYFSLSLSPSIKFLNSVQSQLINYVWSYRLHRVSAKLLYEPYDTEVLVCMILFDIVGR